LLLGLALTTAFLIFAGTTRWTPYGVRYQVPVLVAWCPLIALVAARAKRAAVGAVLAIVLVVLDGPVLLDSTTRPLLHPAWNYGTGLERYLRTWDIANRSQQPVAEGEQAVADIIAGTSCNSIGLANWVFWEYPFWVALDGDHWRGRIDDIAVQDASRSLGDPRVSPCAVVRQVDAGYVTADPDMVSFQFGPMALSMPPNAVGDRAPDQAGFHSDVAGVRVRPGSGWILGGGTPTVNGVTGSARIYLTSDTARTVRLRATGTTDLVGWDRDPDTPADTLETTLDLKPGVTMLELGAASGKAAPLTAIGVVPAPSG
jgi:hypothetical protein